MNKKIIKQGEDNYLSKLHDSVDAYKAGKEDAPLLIVQGEASYTDEKFTTTITKEIQDRDGEVVKVAGINTTNYEHNPVLLDAHQMQGSVITTVLGKIVNLVKTKAVDGIDALKGEIIFANTPSAQVAKSLVQEGFVKTVSMGFGVKDYDHETKTINESELYEVSLVSVPSNVGALIGKGFGIENSDDLVKKLKNYKDIKPKIKEYRAFFLSDEMCELVNYTKTGEELVDIKNIYDLITTKLAEDSEESQADVETPQEQKPKTETPPTGEDEETQTVYKLTEEQLAEIVHHVHERTVESLQSN